MCVPTGVCIDGTYPERYECEIVYGRFGEAGKKDRLEAFDLSLSIEGGSEIYSHNGVEEFHFATKDAENIKCIYDNKTKIISCGDISKYKLYEDIYDIGVIAIDEHDKELREKIKEEKIEAGIFHKAGKPPSEEEESYRELEEKYEEAFREYEAAREYLKKRIRDGAPQDELNDLVKRVHELYKEYDKARKKFYSFK